MHNLSISPGKKLSRVQLAESVGISASGVTRLLAPMEKNGLTDKDSNPRDARMSMVKLTEAGERIYTEASISFEHCANQFVQKLSPRQLEQLIQHVSKLLFV